MRIKAIIAYDGSAFDGFQRQKHTPRTVAQNIENVLKSLGIETNIVASGRTDKGVHATNQVIHFDTPNFWDDTKRLQKALEGKLQFIKIKKLTQVDQQFHARYSAKKRQYRYIFKTTPLNFFEERFVTFFENFDKTKLQEALALFIGEHDFINYCKYNQHYTNTNRHIFKSFYYHHKSYDIITLEANGFLHSQVRMIVYDVMRYAQGFIPLERIISKLNTPLETTKQLAPPNGLYLTKVFY